MESLRNFLTGPTLIFIVLICALPFVFLGTGSLGSGFGGSFGKINGEKVTAFEVDWAANTAKIYYNNALSEEFDFDMLPEEFKSEAIKRELIRLKVLQAGAFSFGLFNDNTIIEAKKNIVRNPLFQNDGVYDEYTFQTRVNGAGHTKDSYIDLEASILAASIYENSLKGINFATRNELYDIAYLIGMTSDISFTKISYQGLKDEVVNTSKELIDYYDKNQNLFFSEEERQFKYFVLEPADYKNNIDVPESYIENAYKDYLSNFDNSAQTRISHIMIDKDKYESEKLAYDQIRVIENLLINGNDFSDIANQYSEDPLTKKIGGDLGYFEIDVFPEEFEKVIENLNVGDFSEIVDLEDTLHVLTVTEINKSEPQLEDEVKNEIIEEAIETESLALMNDDFSLLEGLISDNNSIEEIAESINKEISSSELYKKSNYNFYITDLKIRDHLFSPNSRIDEPYAFELDDKVVVVSISLILEPEIQPFENVAEDVADSLSESKAIEKLALMESEYRSLDVLEDQENFIQAYNFIKKDSYVDVGRYADPLAPLLPQEVLDEIFNNKPNTTISIDANNGDKYFVEIINFNQPGEDKMNSLIDEYSDSITNRLSSKMLEIVDEDIFDSAIVKLNNLPF